MIDCIISGFSINCLCMSAMLGVPAPAPANIGFPIRDANGFAAGAADGAVELGAVVVDAGVKVLGAVAAGVLRTGEAALASSLEVCVFFAALLTKIIVCAS